MLSLSEAYRRGEGVPISGKFADDWLAEASARGMPAAQCARATRLLHEAAKATTSLSQHPKALVAVVVNPLAPLLGATAASQVSALSPPALVQAAKLSAMQATELVLSAARRGYRPAVMQSKGGQGA